MNEYVRNFINLWMLANILRNWKKKLKQNCEFKKKITVISEGQRKFSSSKNEKKMVSAAQFSCHQDCYLRAETGCNNFCLYPQHVI